MATKMVLIHGAFLNARSWEDFARYFTERGYDVSAPEWPCRPVPEGREEDVAGLGVSEIVDHYHRIVEGLPEQPVIVGHSFGGLFTEILLDRGLGLAGVALDPAPPKGVFRLAYSELKVASAALAHPSKQEGVVHLTPEQFDYGFTNTWPRDEARRAYERYYVPETGRIFYEDAFGNLKVHPPVEVEYEKEDRAPLLITAGEHDHTIPPPIARSAYERYAKRTTARTDFHEFPGVSHLLTAGPGWEKVAEYVASWLERVLPNDAVPKPAEAGASRG